MATFGEIKAPIPENTYFDTENGEGIFILISNIFKMAGYIAGLFFLFKLITAGFSYMSASGDPKKTELAWAKIYQSLIGLVIVASAFVISSVIGNFLDIDILNPQLYGPSN